MKYFRSESIECSILCTIFQQISIFYIQLFCVRESENLFDARNPTCYHNKQLDDAMLVHTKSFEPMKTLHELFLRGAKAI